jgi:hypothetical protein
MRDLDSAVGRLDNILISVYVIIAILIIAVTLVRLLRSLSKLDFNITCSRKRNLLRWSQGPVL